MPFFLYDLKLSTTSLVYEGCPKLGRKYDFDEVYNLAFQLNQLLDNH